MRYGLSESNFKVNYEAFKNSCNPHIRKLKLSSSFWKTQKALTHANYKEYNRYKDHDDIFDVAMIVDRKTNKELSQHINITPGFMFYSHTTSSIFSSCNGNRPNL